MKNPIILYFSSPVISRSPIRQKPPGYSRYLVNYTDAELIRLEGGTLLRQYHSHYLFYIELYEFKLDKELSLSYQVEESALFLFFMLDGYIRFSTPDGTLITEADKGTSYATFNKPGEYIGQLQPGIHRIFYIAPRMEWLKKDIGQYPQLKAFIFELDNGNSLYGHMPRCPIAGPIYRTLLQLYELNDHKAADIDVFIQKELQDKPALLDFSKWGVCYTSCKDYMEKVLPNWFGGNNVRGLRPSTARHEHAYL